MSYKQSPIFTDVDYETNGKQLGSLYLPHSVHRSAYGNITIPICVVKNGSGPTILLIAGNHGDEYEGQIAVTRFIQDIDPAQVEGRLVLLPAVNFPAAMAGQRVSPIDNGNFNRSFPGDPDGSPTSKIAHYLNACIFPMCDAIHDFHSGGSSLDYVPFASMRKTEDESYNAKTLAALKAFAPPIAVVWQHSLEVTTLTHACNEKRIVCLGGEFGGRGFVNRDGLSMIEEGIRRLLHYFEVVELPRDAPPPPEMRFMEVRDRNYYLLSPAVGIFEPLVKLGDWVRAGQMAGQVYFVDDPLRVPVPCRFQADGMVICERAMGRVERGDCLYHLASEYDI